MMNLFFQDQNIPIIRGVYLVVALTESYIFAEVFKLNNSWLILMSVLKNILFGSGELF